MTTNKSNRDNIFSVVAEGYLELGRALGEMVGRLARQMHSGAVFVFVAFIGLASAHVLGGSLI